MLLEKNLFFIFKGDVDHKFIIGLSIVCFQFNRCIFTGCILKVQNSLFLFKKITKDSIFRTLEKSCQRENEFVLLKFKNDFIIDRNIDRYE
jgi:hypothetical protein